jgi:hypothetical protein
LGIVVRVASQLTDGIACELALICSPRVPLDLAQALMAGDGHDLMFGAAGLGKPARRSFA